jgi:predicted dehydrogenase
VTEATVYGYHPRIAIARKAFHDANSKPTRLIQAFMFQLHRPGNFRHSAGLGGGAMWDLGPYAITPGRLFFEASPDQIVSRNLSTSGDVDTGFSVLATYSGGRAAVGQFGYTTEYVNRLDIIGPGVAVTMDRAFSPLPNDHSEITIRRSDQTIVTTVPPADTFALFFADVFKSINDGDYSRFADTMLADSHEMDRLRLSARHGLVSS